jgi:hypothetical protein
LEETVGEHTIKKTSKLEFKMHFYQRGKTPGMLRACKESRHILVTKLPIKLPSQRRDIEIRLSCEDVLFIKDITGFLQDLAKAYKHGLLIPPSIRQIHSLALFSGNSLSCTVDRFRRFALDGKGTFQTCLPIFQNLKALVLCCEELVQFVDTEDSSFSEYTTDFEVKALDVKHKQLWDDAKACEMSFESAMQELQRERGLQTNIDELKVPEVKIMVKGWPREQIPSPEGIE